MHVIHARHARRACIVSDHSGSNLSGHNLFPKMTCVHCGPVYESVLYDDFVTGDTICTTCGYILDRSCAMFACDRDHEVVDDIPKNGPTRSTPIPRDNRIVSPRLLYSHILKSMSRYLVDLDRQSIALMQQICVRAVTNKPHMVMKNPSTIALAVYVICNKPAGTSRKRRAIRQDPLICRVCAQMGTTPWSVSDTIKLLEQDPIREICV